MRITITDRIGKPAKDHLQQYKTRFPAFSITNENAYNGVVIEIDDEDKEDFFDAIESAGFTYEADDDQVEQRGAPRWPKFSPKFPKSKPKLQKVLPRIPHIEKTPPKLPRFR